MVTQNVNLTQTTKKIPSIVHVVQGDSGRQVVAKVTDQTISGTASMSFERPDGAVYTSTATINTTDNTMSVNLTSDMLNIAGNAKITFKVTTSNKTVSTFTLVAVIEPSAGFGQTPSTASNKIYVYVNGSAVEIAKQTDVTSLTSRVGANETNIIAINNDLAEYKNERGIDVEYYGIGAYSSSTHTFSDSNKYAICFKINKQNKKSYWKSKVKYSWRLRGGDGTYITENSTNHIDLSQYEHESLFMEIWKYGDYWGTVYNDAFKNEVVSNVMFCYGEVENIFTPISFAYVVNTNGKIINVELGHWSSYKVHLKEFECIKVYVPLAFSTYPLIYKKTDSGISVINNNNVTNGYVYYVATEETDIVMQICCYSSGEYLDAPVFYSDRKTTISKLDGLNLCCIGDSYIANNGINTKYTWCYKISQKHRMKYTNLGINGGGLCATRSGLTPVKDRYSEIPSDTDIIILEGGENDANVSYPTTTFESEFNILVLQIKSAYPYATLVIMCPWGDGYSERTFIKPYADIMRNVANKYGVPFYDSWKQYIFSESSYARSRYYQSASDSSHLNNTGHNIFLPMMENFIERLFN